MSAVQSRNLSIMLTDIQGFSDISASSSREEIISLITEHSRVLTPLIEFYGGRIVKTIGDAFLCTFESATDAVICAITIQRHLKKYNQANDDRRLNIRIVVNTGDVSIKDGDIFGDAVNTAARMEALPCFPGGSIGISESTCLLMNHNEIHAEEIGVYELKGIRKPVRVFSVPLEKQKISEIPEQVQSSLIQYEVKQSVMLEESSQEQEKTLKTYEIFPAEITRKKMNSAKKILLFIVVLTVAVISWVYAASYFKPAAAVKQELFLNLKLNSASAKNAVNMIVFSTGCNIILPSELSDKKVDMNYKQVPLEDALEDLAVQMNAEVIKKNGRYIFTEKKKQ